MFVYIKPLLLNVPYVSHTQAKLDISSLKVI